MHKIAVVTGAGAGVGRATVEAFAQAGYDVALLSRDPGRLERAATELRRYGVRTLPIPHRRRRCRSGGGGGRSG